MSKTNYQCTSLTKTSWLKPPEGVIVTCTGGSSFVQPGTKCKVKCDSGSPNHANVQCKNAGWRPSKELKCEGVNAGVIIGVLIGGIVAVIAIGYIYAKYKEKQKKKLGISTKVQTGKISQHSSRRPGMRDAGHDGLERTSSSTGHPVGIHHQESRSSGSGRQSAGSSRTAPRSYQEADNLRPVMPPQLNSGGRPPPPLPHSDRRGRGLSSKMPASVQQGYDSGYTGYYDETPEPISLPQIGYNNVGYYQEEQPQVGYGYGAHDPPVSYNGYSQPQLYPSSGDYPKPYHVST